MPVVSVWGCICFTQAAGAQPVVIETVPVGNPRNAGESQGGGAFGAVDDDYHIGRFEVTAGLALAISPCSFHECLLGRSGPPVQRPGPS